eukprot:gene10638-10796_t
MAWLDKLQRASGLSVEVDGYQLIKGRSPDSLFLLGVGLLGFAASGSKAEAKNYKDALAQKEARKNKLRETASGIKTSGKDQQVFKSSDYMVSEEARTPNVHSRQIPAHDRVCCEVAFARMLMWYLVDVFENICKSQPIGIGLRERGSSIQYMFVREVRRVRG